MSTEAPRISTPAFQDAARLRSEITEWAAANGGISELAAKAGVHVGVIRALLAGERDELDLVAEYLRSDEPRANPAPAGEGVSQ